MRRDVATLIVLFIITTVAKAADKAGQADYLAGLYALGNSKWPQAIQSFSSAVNADDEDAGYRLALGIAQLASGDAKTAISEMTRAYRLNGKDQTIRRWTAGAYRYAGDELTAAKIDAASDWPGVQQACQEYGQGMKYDQNPKSLADKKAAFEGQIIAFAKAARGDRPEMVQAVGQRVAENVKAGKYDEALRDLKELLKKDPLNEDLLLLQSTAFVGKHRSSMARPRADAHSQREKQLERVVMRCGRSLKQPWAVSPLGAASGLVSRGAL